MPKLEDKAARASNYLTDDADWIDFKTTVCTAPDQIALSPGYLQKEFTRNGRRCFSYAMDRPMLDFYLVPVRALAGQEGRRYKDIPIEVYYDAEASVQRRAHDPGHAEGARVLRGQLHPVPAPPGTHPRVPRLRQLRAELRQHHSVLGIDRVHRRPARQGCDRLRRSTSPRTRSHTSGGRTR